jgi:hypothetical protein
LGTVIGLTDRLDDDLVDVDIWWAGNGPRDAVGDIVAGKGRESFVHASGSFSVAFEAHEGELGGHGAGRDVGDAYR